jgi:phosphatidylglycerophosphate synthase
MTDPKLSRRPLTSRNTHWAAAAARWLASIGLRPNQISLWSLVFATLAGLALVGAGVVESRWRAGVFLAAAAFIQLRLLCNLFDGMVALEGGFKTKSGEIYNELPDRFADVIILAGAGYAQPISEWYHSLGWLAAVLAVITAYVRALGTSAGASQYFLGPMAKPHRMAVMTAACVGMALVILCGRPINLIHPALGIICAGCLITIARRVWRIVRELESK